MITYLRCEYAINPLGIDVTFPRLSWKHDDTRRGWRQTAYQVLVAGSMEQLTADNGDLWDSGKVVSDETAQIPYAGSQLTSRQQCWWKVRSWDERGEATAWSAIASWEMGLLDDGEWQANWIGFPTAEKENPLPPGQWIWYPEIGHDPTVDVPGAKRFFRKQISLPDEAIESAIFWVASEYAALISVNGREVGLNFGSRSAPAYEITDSLHPGTNLLAVQVECDGLAGLLVCLTITYPSRKVLTFRTDNTWRVNDTNQDGWRKLDFDDSDWQAAYVISQSGEKHLVYPAVIPKSACPHLRKVFTLPEQPICRARLYATALGVYEASLNGQRIGDEIFTPGWTDYNIRVQYQAYDVSDLLRPGENVLGLLLGDGWYAGNNGGFSRNFYGYYPLAYCRLEVDFIDGSREALVTDGSWHAAAGPLLQSDMVMGEAYDARREITGWNAPEYNAANWQPVLVHEVDVQLDAQRDPPIRRLCELPALSVSEPVPGHFIFDLGQNMVGWARLRISGQPGERIVLRFGEMLNADGTLYTINLRSAVNTDTYILKGGGEEIFEPRFTFHGFRYVEIFGQSGPITALTITGIVVGSDTPPTGEFTCSNPMVNQLHSNTVWGQRGNYLSVPTDCPQRDERQGWMGDAQAFIRTATYNSDVASFFTKWLVDVADAQQSDGSYTDVAPITFTESGTPAWADAGVICPWTIYRCYADTRLINKQYAGMTRWIDYCIANSEELIRPAIGYGDWLSIGADTPKDLLATAFFAYSTHLVARMALVLGKSDDAARFETLFQRITAAFQKAYMAPDGRLIGGTQTCYTLALRFNLLPEELRETAARYLVEDIKAKGWHISTGFVGIGYLLPVLTDAGYVDVAYRLLLNESFPSWGYSVKQGATTIWERWDGWTEEKGFQSPNMNSFNHYALGSVGEWLFSAVAGIDLDPSIPGFKHCIIHPHLGYGLSFVRAHFDSVYGRIGSAWRIENGVITLMVSIPANTSATIYLPTDNADVITENGISLAQVEDISDIRTDRGCVICHAGAGSYNFTIRIDH